MQIDDLAHRADHERIRSTGETPLVVALVEQQDTSVTMLVTTIAAPPRVLH